MSIRSFTSTDKKRREIWTCSCGGNRRWMKILIYPLILKEVVVETMLHILLNKKKDRVLVVIPLLQMMNAVMANMVVIAMRIAYESSVVYVAFKLD